MTVQVLPGIRVSDEKHRESETANDPLLQRLASEHFGPLNREQLSNRPAGAGRVREIREGEAHIGQLYTAKFNDWYNPDSEKRQQIQKQTLTQMWGETTGYPPEFYAAKDTFREDAGYCFNRHARPKEGCIDWHDDSKRLTDKNWRQRGHDLGLPRADVFLCDFCFSGETEVVTRAGIQRIEDLVGKMPELLVPIRDLHGGLRGTRGKFLPAEVHYFGEQELRVITLRRGMSAKTIYATAEHRWFLRGPNAGCTEVSTAELKPGDNLQPLKMTPPRGKEKMVPFAVPQGFTFGDGSCGREDHRPASLIFYNMEKDGALLPYFALCERKTVFANGGQPFLQVTGLPRSWKKLPRLDESRSFLLSWLAGYFAADGTIDAGGSASVSSAYIENVEFVRSVAAICGVGTSPVRIKMRKGFPDREESALYQITISATDLPDWFWLIPAHRQRALRKRTKVMDRSWQIVSMEPTGKVEPVYCAVVPEIGAFGLADDIMTGNCPASAYYSHKAIQKAGLDA